MAGYAPFKLMKVYEKKDTQDDTDILDCLSGIAVSGSVDDFYAYTHEWMKSVINRGSLFEVSTTTFPYFRQLEILIRGILPQYLLGRIVSRDDVHESILHNEDLICNWNAVRSAITWQYKAAVNRDHRFVVGNPFSCICKATIGRTQTGQEDSNKEKCSIKETNAVIE